MDYDYSSYLETIISKQDDIITNQSALYDNQVILIEKILSFEYSFKVFVGCLILAYFIFTLMRCLPTRKGVLTR